LQQHFAQKNVMKKNGSDFFPKPLVVGCREKVVKTLVAVEISVSRA
jgi:hypothetical protein